MLLDNLLNSELIFLNEDLKTKEEVFEKAAKKISEMFQINYKSIINELENREKLGSTILPNGSAIPHARLENFSDLIISIVRLKNPIDINSQKVDLFFILLTSIEASKLYLKTLAGISRVLTKCINEIRAAKSPKEIIQIVEREKIIVENFVQAKDLMSKNIFSVNINDTLAYAADIMKQNSLIFLVVTDENNKFLGTINIISMIQKGFPEYAFHFKDLSFLNQLKPLEEYLKNEDKIKVKDVYSKETRLKVKETASEVEVLYLIAKEKFEHLVVVDDNDTVKGIISLRDILNKVIRI